MAENWNNSGDNWGGDTNGLTNDHFSNDGDTGGHGFNDENAGGPGDTCRNCGQEGHFARECQEPRKTGPCFNCGEEGHSKADCTKPRVFKGTCNLCGDEGHPAVKCPSKPKLCTRCKQEGEHDTKDCKNNFYLNLNDVVDVTETVAWSKIAKANRCKDIDDFKEAMRMLQKAAPELTYLGIEKQLRQKNFNSIYLIALKKETGAGYTLVNLQGEPEKTYSVAIFKSPSCVRPNMVDKWPKNPEENLERLADAGVPMERGLSYCRTCETFGHTTRDCKQERVPFENSAITCALCGEEGHRVRDCEQERKKPREPRTCKICGSEDHIAKECDQKPKFTCRNCGGEDHKAADCTEPRKLICNNCDKEGHVSRECDQPRDWSKVTCRHCGEKGHASSTRCAPGAAMKQDENIATDDNIIANNDAGTFNDVSGDAGNGWDNGKNSTNGGGWKDISTATGGAAPDGW